MKLYITILLIEDLVNSWRKFVMNLVAHTNMMIILRISCADL